MEIAALCSVLTSLRVLPSRSQFFQYESVTLSCELHGDPSGWRIRRKTDLVNLTEDCPSPSSRNESVCFISTLYYMDSGVYWCESAEGQCSREVNITVTALDVILEAPILPVEEGEAVTLCCRNRKSPGFSFFYKNGHLVGNSSTGNWTIERVSKSDEGFYKCSNSGREFSPDSWLNVRGVLLSGETPAWSLMPVGLPVVGVCLLFALLLLCLRRNLKGKADRRVSYIDVTIIQDVKPQRMRVVEDTSTFYSMLNLAGSSQQLDHC
ncbi:low affinity immunoglobulin gamma Fc region receptor II [Oryzias latipes]|uniref:low affinity immunoglobulin gamma Fc region receptor II n=1 Tax=Oryzias latipes TaxID=8090 RepID=UPI0005CBA557|nr:low affinity immunoglobulin gamma Fc region receptor II [Oryzias latipes]